MVSLNEVKKVGEELVASFENTESNKRVLEIIANVLSQPSSPVEGEKYGKVMDDG